MESRGYDPTLPLDFDGSSNLMELPDITLGKTSSDHDLQESYQSRTMSPGHGLLLPMVAKTSSGRMSPVRGRTMKEYDQQITELKKENFSLKLRIYFLEERMQQKYGDGEDVFKTNIELKVSVQSLKKELEDKQELLRKASQAMETLTCSQQSDMELVRKSLEDQHHRYTEELRSDLQKALQDAEDAREELEAEKDRMHQLKERLQQLEMEQQSSEINTKKLKDAIGMKEREISALRLESDTNVTNMEELQRLLQDVETQRDAAQQKIEQMEKDLHRRGRDVEQLSSALKDSSMIDGQSFLAPVHLQDVVDDQRDNLSRLEVKISELQDELQKKDDLKGKLEEALKAKDKNWKDANNRVQQLMAELEMERKLGSRRDRTIQGLIASLHKKEKEVTSAKSRLSKSETSVKTTHAELLAAEMANNQLQTVSNQLRESEDSNHRLQTQLDEANAEMETMIKSLGKKEGELAGFEEELQKANEALKRSEEALERLQEQLEKERSQAHCHLNRQAQEYQRTLAEYMQQLEGKDSLMAHMTSQLHAKDQQLTSLMDLLTDENNKGQKALLQRLEDDLNKSTSSAQSALKDKQQELEKKGKELRETRRALQDKGRELEDANLQLLAKEEEFNKLKLQHTQQREINAELSRALSASQKALEEALDRHAEALQEKDAIVRRLQKALAEKETMIEELTSEHPALDKQQQQLRAQVWEKEKLIQDLEAQCMQASNVKEQAARVTQARLLEKENEIQALGTKHQKELQNRDQEIQLLNSQLNKKDLQLQSLESRMNDAEEQRKEVLSTMRKMMAEKDKTIEALADSIGEKERLLRRSQQNLTEDAKAQLAEMDTLVSENSRLKELLREKKQTDSLHEGQWQRSNDTRHITRHETITHTNTVDNTQVCRLMEEQIREMHALSDLLRTDNHEQLIRLTSECQVTNSSGENSAQSSAALQRELLALSSLRQRLQEGVERNQQLHQSLLGHTGRHTDQLTSGETSLETDHLFSRHFNLQRSNSDQDGSPSIGCSSTTNSSPLYTCQNSAGADSAGKAESVLRNTQAVQTSPPLTKSLLAEREPLPVARERGADATDTGAGGGEGEVAPGELLLNCNGSLEHLQVLSREASQDSLSAASSLSHAQLAGMSAVVLRDLVSQLQEDLIAAVQRNSGLQKQLARCSQSDGGDRGRSSQDTEVGLSPADLLAQVEYLKDKLKLKDEETARLREHLGLTQSTESGFTGTSLLKASELQDQVRLLRQQLKDMNKVNNSLMQQVALDSGSVGSRTPQQIVNMVTEIERLKVENSKLKSQLKTMPREICGMPENSERREKFSQEVYDGNGTATSGALSQCWRSPQPADSSCQSSVSPQPSLLSPQFLMESCSQELSRNTNRHTDSLHSQTSDLSQWASFAHSFSQRAQNDWKWMPYVAEKEPRGEGRLEHAGTGKLNTYDSTCAQPGLNVSCRLQESQLKVKSLEDRLTATEGTVRFMSQRLRHYRKLLQAAKGGGEPGAFSCFGLARSQSESCLLPQARLSLFLSCNNLQEAAHCANSSRPGSASDSETGLTTVMTNTERDSLHEAFSSVSSFNQQLNITKDQLPPALRTLKPSQPPGAKQLSCQREEDNGAHSQSVEVMRDELIRPKSQERGQMMGGKSLQALTDSTTVPPSEASSCGTELPDSNITTTLHSPQEVTFSVPLGEDVPDNTVMDNLTYTSFSESILPLSHFQGHHDSACSVPDRFHLHSGRSGENDRSSHIHERLGAGDEKACDGNGTDSTLHSTLTGNEESFQSDPSRLKSQIVALTNMNHTLREELNVYDTLCRSMGIQVSEDGETSRRESCDGEVRLLQLHLAELKKLRARMEQLDTDAHTAVQVTALLNDQLMRRIAELETMLARLKDELAQQQVLATEQHTTITEHQRIILENKITHEQQEKETRSLRENLAALQEREEQRTQEHERILVENKFIREQQEKETQLLRENLAALQECEEQRTEELEAEVNELQQQAQILQKELEESRQQVKEMEEELQESHQQQELCNKRILESKQHLQDLETQLTKARLKLKLQEAELHKSHQVSQRLESRLSEHKQQQARTESQLSQAEKRNLDLEQEARTSKEKLQHLEEQLLKSIQQKEEFAASLQAEKQRSEKLDMELSKALQEREQLDRELSKALQEREQLDRALSKALQEREQLDKVLSKALQEREQLDRELSKALQEREQLEKVSSENGKLREDCQEQQQRAQHFQKRMTHYEQCMRDYQHRVQDCEAQVQQLQSSLKASQSKEQDADGKLTHALAHSQHLQSQLKEAESRAHTSESIAHRADTLSRTMEGRLRELECKVKDAEERVRESEHELRVSQTTVTEANINMEGMKRDLAERSAKLRKRDAQLKKLVEEYKKVFAHQKETSQLNQTLKTEIRLYESIHCKTEVSRDKKEELMRQLLSELSQTRRLAEDLISRLEHHKRNDSPASTGGPEAADGRPSPEPRDSLQRMLSEANVLRIHTDSHHFTAESRVSSVGEQSDARSIDSPPASSLFGSECSARYSPPGRRPKTLIGGAICSPAETTRGSSIVQTGQKIVESLGQGHLRSYSHPVCLKYWNDQPNTSLSTLGASPRVEVDSDVRRLFAVSSLEGYEKLRRENGELLAILSSVQARLNDRLKSFTDVSISESVEYSTLRELHMSAQNLRICAEEENRLLSCFWLTQLPPLNARGEFYDPKLSEENETLKADLRNQKSRYELLAHTVREQQERLHATNALRKKWETTLYKQLDHTHELLERSKENFDEAGLIPLKQKFPRNTTVTSKQKN